MKLRKLIYLESATTKKKPSITRYEITVNHSLNQEAALAKQIILKKKEL